MTVTAKKEELINLVKGKKVQIVCHWDADGVCSGALIYHIIKDHADEVFATSKGDVFIVTPEDVNEQAELIICADIAPGLELDPQKVIYIDHHPNANKDLFLKTIHNDNEQSCTLLIYNEIIPDTENPYDIFLVLLGYFGDGGNRDEIPLELHMKANKHMPKLMQKRDSMFSNGYYYPIERYVSALNTGKRMLWKGDVPLSLLIDIEHYEPFINGTHHTAQLLETFKRELKELYNMNIELNETDKFHYSIIECKANVQGVLCARHIKDKPIIVMNKVNGNVIGSMRVPDHVDFDAGKFLSQFNGKIDSYVGGGHEKAGGFTLKFEDFEEFSKLLLDQNKNNN